ncbi:MAG TPA: ribosomal subunit interface protein, partial [Candidatus Latescibacteria bacterium]|nr:ribosomal subunit interface protein [Candidatus Latescibacterota bacterium]
MPVRIDAKNAKLSDSTKEHINKACAKFGQFYDRI